MLQQVLKEIENVGTRSEKDGACWNKSKGERILLEIDNAGTRTLEDGACGNKF